jgi:hypothetical protein
MAIHPDYVCHCMVPVPLIDDWQQDSGLCQSCNGIYDERLYEMQLRKHQPDLPEDADLDTCLRKLSPRYKALVE